MVGILNYQIICADGKPLPVFFKLPVSEISEIDDHKSVSRICRENRGFCWKLFYCFWFISDCYNSLELQVTVARAEDDCEWERRLGQRKWN